MRYIKLFEKFVIQPDVKIFESEKSLNIKNCLNDIFLDVEDEGIEVNIEDKYRRTPSSDIEELIGYKIIIGDGSTAREFASSTLVTNAQTGTTYTFVLADKDKIVELSNASAIALSIPTNSVAYPVGTQINILQTGEGQVTIAAGTPATTTVNGTPGLKLRAQWSSATLIKRATETWVAIGDLSA
jgi:hypothetical protein